MNKRHVILVMAFLCGALSILGMSGLADPSTALAREPNVPPAPPGKTVIIPVGPGNVYVGDVPKAIIDLQAHVLSLEEKVSTLQQGLQAQQTALEKLQTQFLKHTHQYVVATHPMGVETILTCNGYGSPCVANVSSKEITVFVPETIPGQDVTYTTTPPQ
jgi:hypothetical protein